MKKLVLLTLIVFMMVINVFGAIHYKMKEADYKMIHTYEDCKKYQWNDNGIGTYMQAIQTAASIYKKYQFDPKRVKVLDDLYSYIKMRWAKKDIKAIISRVTSDSQSLQRKYVNNPVSSQPVIDLNLKGITYTAYTPGSALSNQAIIEGQDVVFEAPLYINVTKTPGKKTKNVSFVWECYVDNKQIHAEKKYNFPSYKTKLNCKWIAKAGNHYVAFKVKLIGANEKNGQNNYSSKKFTVDKPSIPTPADVAVYGMVRSNDQKNIGIDGVDLVFGQHGATQKTFKTRSYQGGLFKVKLPTGTYTLTAYAKDFETFNIKYLTVRPGMKKVNFHMTPKLKPQSTYLTFHVYELPKRLPSKKNQILWEKTVEDQSQSNVSLEEVVGKQIQWVYRPIVNAEVELIVTAIGAGKYKTYKTDKWGRTIKLGLKPGKYGVKVSKKGFNSYTNKKFEIKAGYNKKRIFLKPSVKLADINGYAYRSNKKKFPGQVVKLGIPNAIVVLSNPQTPGAEGFKRKTTTDRYGKYKFKSIPQGNYYLKIVSKGYKEGNYKKVINKSFLTWKNYLQLTGKTLTYRGKVMEFHANLSYPIAGANIKLISGNTIYRAYTGYDGSFIIKNLPFMTYDSMVIETKGFGFRTFTKLDPKKLMSMKYISMKPLTPRAHVGIKVISKLTKKPVPNCRVLIHNKQRKHYQVTLKDGRCRFSLESDPYYVVIQQKGYERYEKEYKLYKDRRLDIYLNPITTQEKVPPKWDVNQNQGQMNNQSSSGGMFK